MSGDYEDRSLKIRSSSELIPSKDIAPGAYQLENWAPLEDPPFVTTYNELPEMPLDYYGQTQTPATNHRVAFSNWHQRKGQKSWFPMRPKAGI